MSKLLDAFVKREIEGIFGDLCSRVYTSSLSNVEGCYVVLIANIDRSRPKDKWYASVAINLSGNEIEEAIDVLSLFRVRAEKAAVNMKEFIDKLEAA